MDEPSDGAESSGGRRDSSASSTHSAVEGRVRSISEHSVSSAEPASDVDDAGSAGTPGELSPPPGISTTPEIAYDIPSLGASLSQQYEDPDSVIIQEESSGGPRIELSSADNTGHSSAEGETSSKRSYAPSALRGERGKIAGRSGSVHFAGMGENGDSSTSLEIDVANQRRFVTPEQKKFRKALRSKRLSGGSPMASPARAPARFTKYGIGSKRARREQERYNLLKERQILGMAAERKRVMRRWKHRKSIMMPQQLTLFDDVCAAEASLVLRRREYTKSEHTLEDADDVRDIPDTTAITLSGGGVRASAFCGGVCEAFEEHELMKNIDYLSTISGGGFFGTAYVTHNDPFGSEELKRLDGRVKTAAMQKRALPPMKRSRSTEAFTTRGGSRNRINDAGAAAASGSVSDLHSPQRAMSLDNIAGMTSTTTATSPPLSPRDVAIEVEGPSESEEGRSGVLFPPRAKTLTPEGLGVHGHAAASSSRKIRLHEAGGGVSTLTSTSSMGESVGFGCSRRPVKCTLDRMSENADYIFKNQDCPTGKCVATTSGVFVGVAIISSINLLIIACLAFPAAEVIAVLYGDTLKRAVREDGIEDMLDSVLQLAFLSGAIFLAIALLNTIRSCFFPDPKEQILGGHWNLRSKPPGSSTKPAAADAASPELRGRDYSTDDGAGSISSGDALPSPPLGAQSADTSAVASTLPDAIETETVGYSDVGGESLCGQSISPPDNGLRRSSLDSDSRVPMGSVDCSRSLSMDAARSPVGILTPSSSQMSEGRVRRTFRRINAHNMWASTQNFRHATMERARHAVDNAKHLVGRTVTRGLKQTWGLSERIYERNKDRIILTIRAVRFIIRLSLLLVSCFLFIILFIYANEKYAHDAQGFFQLLAGTVYILLTVLFVIGQGSSKAVIIFVLFGPILALWIVARITQSRIFGALAPDIEYDNGTTTPIDFFDLEDKNTTWKITYSVAIFVLSFIMLVHHRFIKLMHTSYRGMLRRAFYADGIDLRLEDVDVVRNPILICNTSLNDYQRHGDADPYCLFQLTPLFCGSERTGYRPTTNLGVSLSRAMAVSGAAFAINVGRYSSKLFRFFLSLYSFTLGDWLSFPNRYPERVIILYVGIPHVLCNAFFFLTFIDSRYVFIGFALYGVLLLLSFFPWGRHVLYSPIVRQFRQALGFAWVSSEFPPPLLYLTDGGHVDNIGLIAMFKRRVANIICIDAGEDNASTCIDLVWAMEKAHAGIGEKREVRETVAFQTMDGRGDVQHLFRQLKERRTPRFMVFKVQYLVNGVLVKEGRLVYVKPKLLFRDDLAAGGPMHTTSGALRIDDDENDDADLVDMASGWCRGDFPHQTTANQFFTKEMFDSYRALGKRTGRSVVKYLSQVDSVWETGLCARV